MKLHLNNEEIRNILQNYISELIPNKNIKIQDFKGTVRATPNTTNQMEIELILKQEPVQSTLSVVCSEGTCSAGGPSKGRSNV